MPMYVELMYVASKPNPKCLLNLLAFIFMSGPKASRMESLLDGGPVPE